MTFENACNNVGLPITNRQRRKWKQKRGLAYKFQSVDIGKEIDDSLDETRQKEQRLIRAKELSNE